MIDGPRIFYYAYSHNTPRGGQKSTYRHVDALRKLGYAAYVLHSEKNFRLTWFENDTPVTDFDECRRTLRPDDIFVLPEDIGSDALKFPNRKVIANRGLYLSYLPFGLRKPSQYPFLDQSVMGMLAASEHNAAHLRFAHPLLRVFVVGPGIDITRFTFEPLERKKAISAYSPKSEKALVTLFHLLHTRVDGGHNALSRFEWVAADGLSEGQVADLLRHALLFVHLNYEEGLPQMPIEAMACGCIVACCGAGPVREIVPRLCCFDAGDLIGIARFIEDVTERWPAPSPGVCELAAEGPDRAAKFSLPNLERRLDEVWRELLSTASDRRQVERSAS
jgi:glycosyltransferase involved in cell wall biosynthesis